MSTADQVESFGGGGGAGKDAGKKKKRKNKKKPAKGSMVDGSSATFSVPSDVFDDVELKSKSSAMESSDKIISKSTEEDQSLNDHFSELRSKVKSMQPKINERNKVCFKIVCTFKDIDQEFPSILPGDCDFIKVCQRKYNASKSAFQTSMCGLKQIETYLKDETFSIQIVDLQVLEQIKLRIPECNRITRLVYELHHFHNSAILSGTISFPELYFLNHAFACAYFLNFGLVLDFVDLIYRNVEKERISQVMESCFKSQFLEYLKNVLTTFPSLYSQSSP